jgi:flavin-dependent dehydrogenase
MELAARGFAVIVCAAPEARQHAPGETLPSSSRPSLEHFGIWPLLAADDSLALRGEPILQAWGSDALVAHPITSAPAWHICREPFDATLLRLTEERGVRVLRNTSVVAAYTNQRGCEVHVECADGLRQTLRSSYLVDATGRRALVARFMGARSHSLSRLVAVRTLWRDVDAGAAGLVIETHPTGWAYAVPLPGRKIVATELSDGDLLPRPMSSLWQGERIRRLLPHIASRLASCQCIGVPTVLAAHNRFSTHVMGRRWIAVGDSAAAFDPLAACGISFALGSAIYAARAIETALEGNPGVACSTYERVLAQFCQTVRHRLLETYATETRWPSSPFWRRRHAAFVAQKRAVIALASAATGAT